MVMMYDTEQLRVHISVEISLTLNQTARDHSSYMSDDSPNLANILSSPFRRFVVYTDFFSGIHLDVTPSNRQRGPQSPALRNDGRIATINITLPVRFRGGALVVRNAEGSEEKYSGRGGKSGDMEWVAYLAECVYETEPVQKGCKLSISYGVYLRTFGAAGVHPEPLITPSDNFLDLFSPILNAMRGRRIAFYMINDYGVDPSAVLAESLVPYVRPFTNSFILPVNINSSMLRSAERR